MGIALVLIKVLGALGVFLYGMKLMSEGLQKAAGQRLKSLLGTLTSNRVSGVLTGFSMTAIVQSSSATTVMVVSFVNAELIGLNQAIGVIMGANIGTTVTGWLVALLGFKVKITSFALPAVALGFGLTFVSGAKPRQIGEMLVGFGLLFLGLDLMKDQVPRISGDDVAWVESLNHIGVLSTLLFVVVGTGLTVVLQSSSATMALTLTLTAAGSIPYEAAAAMILGENIGTTVTANLAAIGTSVAARRAARAHFVFNVIGVIWAVALMHVMLLPLVDALVPGDPMANKASSTAHLAAFHSTFNIINTLLLLPFVTRIAAFVTRLVPEPPVPEPRRVARYISGALVETPELLLVQVRKEMQRMTEVVRAMFSDALRILQSPDQHLGSLVEDTLRREQLVDSLEREVTEVLAMTARAATSATAAREIGELAHHAHRLERIADHCEKLVQLAIRNHESTSERLDASSLEDIARLGALVDRSLEILGRTLVGQDGLRDAEDIEREINACRDEIRAAHIDRMRDGRDAVVPGLRMLDVVAHLEEIGDRTYGIARQAAATESA